MNELKKSPQNSDLKYYFQTMILGVVVFSLFYWYTTWLDISNALNKTLANTAVLLIGLSMLLTSVCYFWNFLDTKIIYRKYLGLIGFAFGVTHIIISYTSLLSLLKPETWSDAKLWPVFTAFLATLIFMVMTLISNKASQKLLGGKIWKRTLRLGYLALIFVFVHIFLLKSVRWITWWQEGMNSPPTLSLIMSLFILIVIVMRILLFFALRKKRSEYNKFK